jgi:hypothetical protein
MKLKNGKGKCSPLLMHRRQYKEFLTVYGDDMNKKHKAIIDAITLCFDETPAQKAARVLYEQGIRETDFDYKVLTKCIPDMVVISVRAELHYLERINKK